MSNLAISEACLQTLPQEILRMIFSHYYCSLDVKLVPKYIRQSRRWKLKAEESPISLLLTCRLFNRMLRYTWLRDLDTNVTVGFTESYSEEHELIALLRARHLHQLLSRTRSLDLAFQIFPLHPEPRSRSELWDGFVCFHARSLRTVEMTFQYHCRAGPKNAKKRAKAGFVRGYETEVANFIGTGNIIESFARVSSTEVTGVESVTFESLYRVFADRLQDMQIFSGRLWNHNGWHIRKDVMKQWKVDYNDKPKMKEIEEEARQSCYVKIQLEIHLPAMTGYGAAVVRNRYRCGEGQATELTREVAYGDKMHVWEVIDGKPHHLRPIEHGL